MTFKKSIHLLRKIMTATTVYITSLIILLLYSILFRWGEFFLVDVALIIPIVTLLTGTAYTQHKTKHINLKNISLSALAGILILVSVNEAICLNYSYFSEKNWESTSLRHFMLNDLTRNYLKKGMRAESVVRLLGQPASQYDNDGNWDKTISHVYEYRSYYEKKNTDQSLELYFDSQSQLIDWHIVEQESDWL